MNDHEKHEMTPLETLRHSAAHIMADAVQRLFPEAKVTIGPPVEEGFYYDFDYPKGFTPDDLVKIEKVMADIIHNRHPFERREISKREAIEIFKKRNEPYKIEIINELPGDTVTMYRHGNWEDLCRGPHVTNTGEVKAFKLLKVAGAYWRGVETNPQLQRIYGTAFSSVQELEQHLVRLEEAAKRDHRKIGKELDLFSTLEDLGAGLILWHPKGARIRHTIEEFWRREHLQNGYELLYTPHIAQLSLWKQSGHWDFYRENMYAPMTVDGVEYELKPMNCPFHIQIYKRGLKSYRDLPLRWAELGTVYRYERSGVLHGLMRVRGFTQDDAHIFCRPDQLESEITTTLQLCTKILAAFGFTKYDIYLSTRPEKRVGSDAAWEDAERALRKALETSGLSFHVDPGEGVFYGPKIDIKIMDSLNRAWQCSTIQVDFNLPERYHLEFVDTAGKKVQPIMIHRALLGSLERFFGILIEHYAGVFPLWLAPVQARLVPITADQNEYAKKVSQTLLASGLRVDVDDREEKLNVKIRDAENEKIPYMLVVGKREAAQQALAVRSKARGDLGVQAVTDVLALLQSEVEAKRSLS